MYAYIISNSAHDPHHCIRVYAHPRAVRLSAVNLNEYLEQRDFAQWLFKTLIDYNSSYI